MKYQFILSYKATDSDEVMTNTCHPVYGDDLSVTIDREDGEWYYKRTLDGKITFERDDYRWIMARPFDGTFTLTVNETHDGGASWHPYFEGTFSRANLEIDEDNQAASLSSFIEGVYNAIENGKDEEYDLMKIIPDSDAKEVQGQVHPALAMVDYISDEYINSSDMFCNNTAFIGPGYKGKSGYSVYKDITSTAWWTLLGLYAEAKVESANPDASGFYTGNIHIEVSGTNHTVHSINGEIQNDNGYYLHIVTSVSSINKLWAVLDVYDNNGHFVGGVILVDIATNDTGFYCPPSLKISGSGPIEKVTVYFHYIRGTLLTAQNFVGENSLDTGGYYKGMQAFPGLQNNYGGIGLTINISRRTVDQPNGHRLIPGTGEQGTTPQYFAPPDESHDWIPLAEDNWHYGSIWYTIQPSVANGLLDQDKIGSFRWTRCWTLGTCLNRLLRKITDNKVTFDESTAGSEFLYSTINPVTGGEPFEYLFTQKSNVMNPGQGNTGESAARCPVSLDWFLEFMRNGLNCYWWLEPRNGGTYAFRVEHVEWFRRGGSYTGQLNAQINLTEIKPLRNFLRNGDAAKRLDDQLHKYSYDMSGMTEKYTFSWQGDGGSDAFKGHPMVFRAGWIEKGSSESHEVDNIFADLEWLMLNAGSDTASAQNYEGVFIFSGYRPDYSDQWAENKVAPSELVLNAVGVGNVRHVDIDVWLTMDEGVTAELVMGSTVLNSWSGTGEKMLIRIDVRAVGNLTLEFTGGGGGEERVGVTIHRIHAHDGYAYNVPNVENLLGDGYLQNGPLAWPWLQNEYLHYDVPARRWGFKADSADELDNIPNGWLNNGTVKLCKKQDVPLLPLPTKSDEDNLDLGVIGGLRDSNNQLQTGIVKEAKINLGTRNAELTLMYDMIS